MDAHDSAPKYPLQADIEALSALFRLGPYSQDWDVETADGTRVEEFIDAYDRSMSPERRFALMLLILASLDERVRNEPERAIDSRLVELLRADFDLHRQTLRDWACLEATEPDEAFSISEWARNVLQACSADAR